MPAAPIPIVDLFAGPGGLGEGFSSLRGCDDERLFKIKLSIEMDEHAHSTLELRAFFREFEHGQAPKAYYEYLAGAISRFDLFDKYRDEARRAAKEAWHAELGSTKTSHVEVDQRIRGAVGNRENWVLIGGPPCQAYSLAGRSRRKNDPAFATDEKHFLYRQYLRILAEHRPAVFVMENVKGLLSAKVEEEGIFARIMSDLENPLEAEFGVNHGRRRLSYTLYPLSVRTGDLLGKYAPEDFVVKTEEYGIPQSRHRIIIVGIQTERMPEPRLLERRPLVAVGDVLNDLPRLRSGLSKELDSPENWSSALREMVSSDWFRGSEVSTTLRREMRHLLKEIESNLDRGADFLPRTRRTVRRCRDWFEDIRLQGVINHTTRSHIRLDLHRYFFASAYARIYGKSPLLEDFPIELLPLHRNVIEALEKGKFNDRFRVQVADRPSTTVTSHISKDGHYFIHPDPTQCRSLTVREAARLQTFPDNYFFEGTRTQQYHQVGNAVPPLLARQIAEVVAGLFVAGPNFA